MKKRVYVSPSTDVVEMKSEKMLCGSPSFSSSFIGSSFTNPFGGGGADW